MKRLVYGVGINDGFHRTSVIIDGESRMCPIYRAWTGMLDRVYSKTSLEKAPSYSGCFVCDEWLLFSNFRSWMVCQDWKEKQLDKDILIPGNKEYSPRACCFVDASINTLLAHNKSKNSGLPTRVEFYKNVLKCRYRAKVIIDGKRKELGYFSTSIDAGNAYIKAKSEEIRRQGRLQTNPSIMIGLFRHAHLLEQKLTQLEK